MNFKRDPITNAKALETLRISPSSINTFFQCAKKWYFEYVKAIQTDSTIHLIRGNIVHKTLEDIFKVRYYPSGEAFRNTMMNKALNIFNNYWDEDLKELVLTTEDNDMYYEESKYMIERFVTRYCDNIQDGIKSKKYSNESQGYYFTKPTFKELWIDDQFKINFNEKWKSIKQKKEDKIPFETTLNVGGFIDSVQKDFDKNIILVDYKTSSKYQNVLSSDYVRQLSIYAYLWYIQTGSFPAYVCINYLKYDESYYILVTPDLVNHAVNEIKLMRSLLIQNGLTEENYCKKPSKLCDWCGHKNKCCGLDNEKN